MTIQLGENGTILLIDDCPAEDADVLLQNLLEHPDAAMDWAGCTSAHTAVIQVILAAGRGPTGTPDSAFLTTLVGPALGRGRGASSAFPGRQGDANS